MANRHPITAADAAMRTAPATKYGLTDMSTPPLREVDASAWHPFGIPAEARLRNL